MRLLYLVGGSDVIAGGATARDAAFVRGLLEEGHDVVAVSLYGPAGTEGEGDLSKVFHSFGNTSLRRLFPRLTKVSGRLAGFVRGSKPGADKPGAGRSGAGAAPFELSLLSGTNKPQAAELARLIAFLGPFRPHATILAGTMLSGLAEPLQTELGCPIICLTQGSDRTVESLAEPYRSEARKRIRKNARLFRCVVASSRYAAIRAAESLALPAARIRIVPPGVDAHRLANPAARRRVPFTIGYMAPINKDRGLDILLDAVEGMNRDSAAEAQIWIAGPVEDERYWAKLLRRLESGDIGAAHKAWGGNLAARERREFMEGLSVFAVTAREPESRGTHILEAMAAGVPIVAPSWGIVPEIFQYASGGLLVSSEAPAWMFSQALELLATMPDTADEMGQTGCDGVRAHFSIENSTRLLVKVIGEALSGDTVRTVREKI